MRKIERLKREALESCRFRGHKMEHFKNYGNISKAYSQCKVCLETVAINAYPLPNSIEIGGEAVALYCRGEVCTRPLCDCVECREC